LINELVGAGKISLEISKDEYKVTFHDPCYLGRHNGILAAPRQALDSTGITTIEMPRNERKSFCCGAGGAQMWKEEEPGNMRVNEARFKEAKETGADTLAVGCPFCMTMLSDASRTDGGTVQVKDVAELVAERMKPGA
jgi:Fe-S oxidoreductase